MRRVDLASDGHVSTDAVATGFPSIDRWLGSGLRRGDLVVLGGDVGSGKSALSLAMALRMAQSGAAVAFLTGEMTPERVMERALAIEGRARVDDLRKGSLDEMTRTCSWADIKFGPTIHAFASLRRVPIRAEHMFQVQRRRARLAARIESSNRARALRERRRRLARR